jgi:TolA-binding protein
MKKRYFSIGDWKRNVMIVTMASCLGMTACNSNQQDSGSDWSSSEETTTQGVITELTEISPDEWKITDERPAGPGQVAAIVRHLDGKVDTLQGEALKRQMQDYAAVNPTNTHGNGMMNVLMWSGLGYMAGRMMSPSPRYYANPAAMQQGTAVRSSIDQQRSRSSTIRRSAPSGRTGVMSGRGGGFSS